MLEELFGDESSRFARTIRRLRGKRGLTQKQVADFAGISETAYRSYELGARKAKPEISERIAKTLKVRPEYLSSPEFGPYMEFYYAILENEDTLGYTVTKINGQPAIVAKPGASSFFALLSNWNEMKEKLEAKEITREEYEDFKETYDGGTWMNTPDGKSPWTGK